MLLIYSDGFVLDAVICITVTCRGLKHTEALLSEVPYTYLKEIAVSAPKNLGSDLSP